MWNTKQGCFHYYNKNQDIDVFKHSLEDFCPFPYFIQSSVNNNKSVTPKYLIFFLFTTSLFAFCLPRHGEPPVVALLVLAEPADAPVLVEVRPGGAAASRPGPPGADGLPPAALGLRRSRSLAPQHRPGALPFLQVCPTDLSKLY